MFKTTYLNTDHIQKYASRSDTLSSTRAETLQKYLRDESQANRRVGGLGGVSVIINNSIPAVGGGNGRDWGKRGGGSGSGGRGKSGSGSGQGSGQGFGGRILQSKKSGFA